MEENKEENQENIEEVADEEYVKHVVKLYKERNRNKNTRIDYRTGFLNALKVEYASGKINKKTLERLDEELRWAMAMDDVDVEDEKRAKEAEKAEKVRRKDFEENLKFEPIVKGKFPDQLEDESDQEPDRKSILDKVKDIFNKNKDEEER